MSNTSADIHWVTPGGRGKRLNQHRDPATAKELVCVDGVWRMRDDD